MTLKEWIDEQITDMRKFQDWWTEQTKINPNMFPNEMQAGDWDEQFQFFAETFCKDLPC